MNFLNNRELALAIWIAFGLILMLLSSKWRRELWVGISAFFQLLLVKLYVLVFLYSLICIKILGYLGLWSIDMLKDTILWFITVGMITLFRLNKAGRVEQFFREGVLDVIKFTAILEFFVGLYPFDLWIEILLVPLVLLLVVGTVFSEGKPKYANVRKFINGLLALYGFFVLVYNLYEMIIHYREIVAVDMAKDFFLPPLLTLGFFPFVYGVYLFSQYETTFIVIDRYVNPPELAAFAKRQALLRINFNIPALKRWRESLAMKPVHSRQEVVAAAKKIRRLQAIEKIPPIVSFDLGWSPYVAKEFLAEKGIVTNHYKDTQDNSWNAISRPLALDDLLPPNNISYYVTGQERAATKLYIILNLNSPENEILATASFRSYARLLYRKALDEALPAEVEEALVEDRNIDYLGVVAKIAITKTPWETKQGGYSLKFEIQHKADDHSMSY